jgi:hypothetical protein
VIRFLGQMCDVGRMLFDENRVPDPVMSQINSYYSCEITDQELRLCYQTDPLIVPKRQAKGSGLNCNFFDETLKFFKGTRNLKGGDPFWERCLKNLEEVGEEELLIAVREFRTRLDDYEVVLGSTSATNERFYYLVRCGSAKQKPVTEKVTHQNMGSLGLHSDAVTIIMTYQGAPVTGNPEVVNWWRKRCSASATTPKTVDIVRGELCRPSRLIERIRSIDTPLVSFNRDSPAFGFDGLSQAFNFPVAQETQDLFNTGLGWIVRRDGGQSVILSNIKPSTVEIGWWPEGVLDHPILTPLVEILHGAKKKLVENAWLALAALTVDSTLINFAAWSRAKSRFAFLDQWCVPADELRVALLRFHGEFGHTGYDPVRWTITHENGEAPPTLHPSCFLPTFKAVVTGSEYPDNIATYYYNNSHKWSTESSSVWIKAYLSRKFNTSMAKPHFKMNLDPIRTQYPPEASEMTPRLEDHLNETVASLNPLQLSAFNYGVMLALYAKLKWLYHWGHTGEGIDTWDTPNKFRYPRRFFSSEIGKLANYRGWLEENQRSRLYSVVSEYLSQYMPKIDVGSMERSIPGLPMYTGIGWEQGTSYLQELSNYTRQMEAYMDNTVKNSKPNTPDPSAQAAQ